jgi:malic enzyme
VWGKDVLIHWEDFGSGDAARILARYRAAGPTFNDDIQSTAAVALAAVLGAARLPGVPPLREQTAIVIAGAGQASLGIARLLIRSLRDEVRCAVATRGLGHLGVGREGTEDDRHGVSTTTTRRCAVRLLWGRAHAPQR